jgi:hypothetical protein
VNRAKDVYETTILLSVPGNDPSVGGAVAACIEDIVLSASTPPARVIIHASRTLMGDRPGSSRRRTPKKLLALITRGNVGVWTAGTVGEALDLLRPDEVERMEAEPGGTLGTMGRRYFPLRIRSDQVENLVAREIPLCIGYPNEPRPWTVSALQVWEPPRDGGSGWMSIPTLYVPAGDVPSAERVAPEGPLPSPTGEPVEGQVGIVHLVLPRGDATELEQSLRTCFTEVWPGVVGGGDGRERVGSVSLTEDGTGSPAPSGGTAAVFVSGCAPYPPGREPAILAVLDALRSGSAPGPADLSSLLFAAGDTDTTVDRTLRRRRDRSSGGGGENRHRELEGAGTGYFTLAEGPLRALFIGGRICGVFPWGGSNGDTAGSAENQPSGSPTGPPAGTPAVNSAAMNGTRAQGHLRIGSVPSPTDSPRRDSGEVHYLETIASAWFSSGTTRGVQERAGLPGGIVVDNEAVIFDGVPALLFGQSVSLPENPVQEAEELVLFEIPLGSAGDAHGIAAERLPGDEVSWRVYPSNDPGAERELCLSSRHLVVASSGVGPVRITPADRSGSLIVPYRLAVVPKNGGDQIVLRLAPPLYAEQTRPLRWPEIRRWSVSYIMSLEGVPGAEEIESSALITEVPGFYADLSSD